eukprot:Awhi_evm1s9409
MRELHATGYISNRGRQNIASFLINELKVDWRLGADYLEAVLIDHDVASNTGNWLQQATLTGGRVNRYNTVKQSKEFDSEGNYIRRWVPELRLLLNHPLIHEPWLLRKEEKRKYKIQEYPNKLPSLWTGYRD